MFLIAGIGNNMRELGSLSGAVCPACGGFCTLTFSEAADTLHLFFIPTARWNRRYFAVCGHCGAAFAVEEEDGRRICREGPGSFDPRRLGEIVRGGARRCRSCGASLDGAYAYCPHCGARQ